MQGPLPRPGSRPTRASAVVRRGGRSVIGAVQPGSAGGGLPGLGSELVHAADAVGLEPGRRFLFELFSGGERAARDASQAATQAAVGGESGLLATLRAALGAEEPLGNAVSQLERELDAQPAAERELRERLRRALERCVFRVGRDGAVLARALRESGQCREARFLAAGFTELGGDGQRRAERLARALLADWLGSEAVEDFARELQRGLRAELRAECPGADERTTLERWLRGEPVGELPRSVGVLLERALAHTSGTLLRETLLESLRAFELDTLPRPLREALVRALCGFDAPLPANFASASLADDLKGELLLARAGLAPGALKDAVLRLLAAIEAEQWINVARQAARLSSHWSLPIRDGERCTTAHVFVHRSYFRPTQAARGAPAARRMALALEAGSLGIVQAELLVGAGEVALRVLAADEAAACELRAMLPELERRLSKAGRSVRASVAVSSSEPPQALDPVRALSWLVDHNVVDMEV